MDGADDGPEEIEGLRANVSVLLAPPETDPESTPTALVDDTVLSTLFGDGMPSPDSSRAAGKCPRSGGTSDDTEAERDRKRERQLIEVDQRASIVDGEFR
uniref:Integrase core domain containing protein n=1 Tax=Solanum tuberosum TaxID=4113 RepID=M1DIB3_SOLTU